MPLGTEVGLSLGDIVLDGNPAPPPLNGTAPNFRPMSVVAGQTTGWTKMPLGMDIGLSPGNFVFDGDPAARRRNKGHSPTQFLAHVYCGQTAEWIKMPLATGVNLDAGDVVLDWVTATSFWPMSIVAKRLDG